MAKLPNLLAMGKRVSHKKRHTIMTTKTDAEKTARELIERHLTNALVSQLRSAAALKIKSFNLAPRQLIGVIKVDEQDKAFWSVEQRFGFPYQDIQDRNARRVVFDALEEQDDDSILRIIFLDVKHGSASSLRVPIAAAEASS